MSCSPSSPRCCTALPLFTRAIFAGGSAGIASPLMLHFWPTSRLLRTARARPSSSSSPARLSAPAAISKDKSTAADSDTAGGDRPRSSLCNSRGCSPKKERFAMPDLHGGGNLDKYESFRFLFLFFCSFKLESAWCGSSGDFALLQPLPEPPSWCLTVYKHPCWENKTFIAERGSSATIKKRLYWSPTALLLGGGNGVEKTKNNPSVLAVNQARKIEPKCKTNGLGN